MLYYFVLLSLPPLSLKTDPEMTFMELKDILSINLTKSDYKKVLILLRPIDLENVRAFWLGIPLNERGTLNAAALEEALLVQDNLPIYFVDYLNQYETTEERLKYFPSLVATLFQETEQFSGFMKDFYQFERERMLILTALRAKLANRDIVRELQFEDPTDPLIANILAQKDAADYIPPSKFEKLKILFVENSHNPEKLNRAILEYRLEMIEEMEENYPPFSMDRVLSYVARFLLIDSLRHLDLEKANMEVENLSKI